MKNVEEKKKVYLSKKPIAKLRPHQMTGASRAVKRERQNSNKQSSVYLSRVFFGFFDSLILFVRPICYKTVIFYHQDTVFECNLFHNGHKQ